MPTYRRVIEVFTGEDKNIYRTVRVDTSRALTPEELMYEWDNIIITFQGKYETQVRFVPPWEFVPLSGYSPPIPGETSWDWAGEEQMEI